MGRPAHLVDSHLHLVNLERFRYYWLKPELEVLQRSFPAEEIRPLYRQNDVTAAVVVQAHPSPEETRYLVEVAAGSGFIAAVVGHVDLSSPAVEADLAGLPAHPLVKGVRHQQAEDQAEGWFLREEVLRGLRAVSEAGLIYDLLVRPQHLPSIPRVMEKVPDLRVVLEHMGKPPIASGALRPWADHLAAVAEYPSVRCKLSELVTQADPAGWSSEDLKPYVQQALACFGPGRLMWGSGWPVCLLAASFEETLTSTLEALGPLPEAELEAIFSENARSCYGLE